MTETQDQMQSLVQSRYIPESPKSRARLRSPRRRSSTQTEAKGYKEEENTLVWLPNQRREKYCSARYEISATTLAVQTISSLSFGVSTNSQAGKLVTTLQD